MRRMSARLQKNAMPLSPRHKEQKSKNITLFAVLVAVVVVLFGLTVMKISGVGAPQQPAGVGSHAEPE